MDDVALVAAVQRGDEEALADLFEECHAWTYSTCLNALRDTDAAEEATARVFETAIRTRLAGAYALRPAMIRLIHEQCTEVEQERQAGRSRRKASPPPAAPDPTNLRLVAWRAAGDLRPDDRILFALAAGMALSNESIAMAVSPDKPAAVVKRLDVIREHVVADVLAARSLDDCEALRDTLRYSAKEPDAAARKKVHAHLAGRRGTPPCPKCVTAYGRWPLGALAALLPLTAVPAGMSDRLLDRMELALRAGPSAGKGRTRVVIDGTMASPGAPSRPAPPSPPPARPSAPASPGRRTSVGTESRLGGAAARAGDVRSGDVRGDDVRGDDVRGDDVRGDDVRGDDVRSGGAAARSGDAPDARGGRVGPVSTTAVLAATVLVLGVAGVVALATHRSPVTPAESLVADPIPLPRSAGGTLVPRPVPSIEVRKTTRPPTAAPTRTKTPKTSPAASIRPVAGSAAPTRPPNPFDGFGALTILAPGSVAFSDPDARTADVTLSVAVPDGFDTGLLDSTLSWSGSYVLKQETQDVDLGSGQDLAATLTGAARCTTVWTVTATLTPPNGAAQYATTEISVDC
ncbi:RNA polymerase sigma factor [Cryptosporangium arvum]|uniref:RNA polymerase sigma factor n=1 Tax=Cryptosporangium arvum TaxID=80871 RepID=UPI0004B037C8|nr:hypothetical protein [Cryptosporangium arvum]